MKKRIVVALTLVVVLVATGSVVWANGRPNEKCCVWESGDPLIEKESCFRTTDGGVIIERRLWGKDRQDFPDQPEPPFYRIWVPWEMTGWLKYYVAPAPTCLQAVFVDSPNWYWFNTHEIGH